MCRNIRTLYNYEPRATEDEVRAASLQYVRKISGFTKPSQANAEAFEEAVDEVTAVGRAARRVGDVGAAEGPRGRGGQGARPRGGALRDGLAPPEPLRSAEKGLARHPLCAAPPVSFLSRCPSPQGSEGCWGAPLRLSCLPWPDCCC